LPFLLNATENKTVSRSPPWTFLQILDEQTVRLVERLQQPIAAGVAEQVLDEVTPGAEELFHRALFGWHGP
jgi:hypothetical protein